MRIDVLQEHSTGLFTSRYQIAWKDGEMIDYQSLFSGSFEHPVSGYYPSDGVLVQPKHYIHTTGDTPPIIEWQRQHNWKYPWYGVWH